MSDITVIGGITADIEGNPYGQLVFKDSNPGKISISYGGVGRNITENLARMGADVALVSVAGDDFTGRGAVRELKELGADTSNIHLLEHENTAMYLSILNIFGEMELALCNMDVLEKISPEFITQAMPGLKASKIVALDTNLTEETLDYITSELKDVPLFLDPVSVAKAERAKKYIGRFHTIKPNRMEAEVLTGMEILDEEQLEKAGARLLDQGVKRVFISMGAGGVFYKDHACQGILRPKQSAGTSVTGAGDAFSAAILDGFVKNMDMIKTAEYGMAASEIAMKSSTAVNPEIGKLDFK